MNTGVDAFYYFAYLSLFLNAFNLLLIMPLDGGHYLNEAVFSRSPAAELVFKVIALACLAFIAFSMRSIVFGVLTFFMLMMIKPQYDIARITKRLRSDTRSEQLDIESVDRIRVNLSEVNPSFENHKNNLVLPRTVKSIWDNMNKKFPSVSASFSLIAAYLVLLFVVIPVSFVFVVKAAEQGGIDWSGMAG